MASAHWPQARIELANCPCQNGTLFWSTFASVRAPLSLESSVRAPLSVDGDKLVCTTCTCPSVCMCCHMATNGHTFSVWPFADLRSGVWMRTIHCSRIRSHPYHATGQHQHPYCADEEALGSVA